MFLHIVTFSSLSHHLIFQQRHSSVREKLEDFKASAFYLMSPQYVLGMCSFPQLFLSVSCFFLFLLMHCEKWVYTDTDVYTV